jgi:hypothetical protein
MTRSHGSSELQGNQAGLSSVFPIVVRLLLPALLLAACSPTATSPGSPAPSSPSSTAPATPTEATSDLLLTGDVSWARFIEDWAHGRTGWPFKRLDEFGTYDGMVGNLECPVFDSDEDSEIQERLLSFHCQPKFLAAFSEHFFAVSLANNHTDNHGEEGLAATRRDLTSHGIQYFGDPDPEQLERACAPILVPVRTDVARSGVLPVAMCGWNGVFSIPSADSVDQISAWADHVPVLAFPHSGLEYVDHPDSIKVDLYRDLIDAGADAVLGSHPHWIQPTEAWHGRLIAYSLGNFLFDQQNDGERTRSAALHLQLTLDGDVAAWLEVGQKCADDPDHCLAIIEQSGLPEMPAQLRFSVVGTANEARLTHPASAAETAAIEQRLDWEQTLASLQ